uniref:Ig-like domain-containing protein n=1 Tax=Ornithorhynchus anatinus TaxID=9258 RepID=A0A6I8PR79_ORNAN
MRPLLAFLLLGLPFWSVEQQDFPRNFCVDQLPSISAPEGSTVTLPCRFFLTWRLVQPTQVTIIWKWRNFHGPVIFDSSQDKQGRRSLVGDPKKGNGSLQIRDLTKADETRYFCRIQALTTEGEKIVQNITGTWLTVKRRVTPTATSEPPGTEDNFSSPFWLFFTPVDLAASLLLCLFLKIGTCVALFLGLRRQESLPHANPPVIREVLPHTDLSLSLPVVPSHTKPSTLKLPPPEKPAPRPAQSPPS